MQEEDQKWTTRFSSTLNWTKEKGAVPGSIEVFDSAVLTGFGKSWPSSYMTHLPANAARNEIYPTLCYSESVYKR